MWGAVSGSVTSESPLQWHRSQVSASPILSSLSSGWVGFFFSVQKGWNLGYLFQNSDFVPFWLGFSFQCTVLGEKNTSNLFLLPILWMYTCKKSPTWTLFIQYVGQAPRKEEIFCFPLNLIAFVHKKVFWKIMMPSWFCIHQIYNLAIYLLEAYERLGLQHKGEWKIKL